MRIYVASSWRNERISEVVAALRAAGHAVYDFREDDEHGAAFNWSDIDPDWQKWTPQQFVSNLEFSTRAQVGFIRDFGALQAAEGLLLVMPCGRSAHLELGFAIGAGKPTAVLLSNGEPELMYKAVGKLCVTLYEALGYFACRELERSDRYTVEAREVTKKRPC